MVTSVATSMATSRKERLSHLGVTHADKGGRNNDLR